MMREHNISKRSIFLVVTVFMFILLGGFVSATFTVSNPQTAPFTSLFTSSTSSADTCSSGNDFILQISPLGCQPTVVRSDLLEEQDVPVFCPLAATQMNPSIDVNSISRISFSGSYSKYIQTVGFYPAQAALSTNGQLANYPVLSNVGYVVIDLKQQPNESYMPSNVSGVLTAHMTYDATNTFGLGNTNFYLPVLTDSDWKNQHGLYNFLNGKGFVRVDSIQGNSATISVYDSSLNRVSSVTLNVGDTSGDLSVPGINTCTANMNIKLNSISNPGTMAKLEINGNPTVVAQGEGFLGNKCTATSIDGQGLYQKVTINCNGDSGSTTFNLLKSPQVIINIGGTDYTHNLGDFLYQNGNNYVYLGYIGNTDLLNSDKTKSFVVLVSMPNHNENQLSGDELASISSLVQQLTPTRVSSIGITNSLGNIAKSPIGLGDLFLRNLVSGQNIKHLNFQDQQTLFGTQVEFKGFAQSPDSKIDPSASTYYKDATADYQSVLNSFASETYSTDPNTLGEQALYQHMLLANLFNQKETLTTLCENFKQRFPNANEDISFCDDLSSFASSSISSNYISINGQAYQISLQNVQQPTLAQYGATILVQSSDGKFSQPVELTKNQKVTFDDNGNFVQLVSLTHNTATIQTKAKNSLTSDTTTLQLNTRTQIGTYYFTLAYVNLSNFAQVSLIPKSTNSGSEINFTFNIGIEKRLIQLNPNQTKKKIADLNKSIAQLEKISNVTGDVLSGMQKACVATGAFLTVKNLLSGGFQSLARQSVMNSYWNQQCTNLVSQGQYNSQDDCLIKNSDKIDSDVNQMSSYMQTQQDQIKNLQSGCTKKSTSFLSQDYVDNNCLMQSYSGVVSSSLDKIGSSSVVNPSNSKESISVSDAKNQLLTYKNYQNNNYNVQQARDIQLYSNILSNSSASDSLKTVAKQGLYSTLVAIQTNTGDEVKQQTFASQYGFSNADVSSLEKTNDISVTKTQTFGDWIKSNPNFESSAQSLKISDSDYVMGHQDPKTGKQYVITYSTDGVVTGTYLIVGNELSSAKDQQGKVVKNPFSIFVKQYSESSYQNKYKDPKIQYFETDPYKGMPAIVPFDTANGWYAAVKQSIPAGGATQTLSYDASGRIESFYLCNVGQNGIEEGIGGGDDICRSINLGTNQPYDSFPGLTDSSKVKQLVDEAASALQTAAKARQQNPSGLTNVIINGQNIPVGQPASNSPAIQCEDFMSPSDCNILFNVCDPVVCPTSRCNFGGKFPVQDVASTGIVGSIALCMPNFVGFGGTDVIPVCLTGVKSGLDNWISIKKDYAQCLQENLDTGKTTGICDEINSIYLCQFFWQQAAPLANVFASKIGSVISGENTQGGGEYLSVQNALQNTKSTVSYLTTQYGANALKAFNAQSTQNIGSTVCQNFASLAVPNSTSILDQMATPDSPPQFTGSFDTIPYTTATVPPVSEYKVFYHIYAGKNQGIYYSVYMKRSTGTSYYQDSSSQRAVDSGYVKAGGSISQTKDFTAPTGYDQMCINVNGQENCGFKQVSSSLAINYLQNLSVAAQVNNTHITTQSDCESGTANIYGFLNANAQAGASSAINPQIYNEGITRICSTGYPDGADPYKGTQSARWIEVGYCDNTNVGCWLDTKSVKNVLTSPDIGSYVASGTTSTVGQNTLQSVQDAYLSILSGSNYLTNDQFDSAVKGINSEPDPQKKIDDVNKIIDRVFYNNQKGELLLLRGNAYAELAKNELSSSNNGAPASTSSPQSGTQSETGNGGDSGTSSSGGTTNSVTSVAPGANSGITLQTVKNAVQYAKTNHVGNTNQLCQCSDTGTPSCDEIATSVYNSATKYDENPLLVLAVLIRESECKATAQNANDPSYGLMQIYYHQECKGIDSSLANSPDAILGASNYDKNVQCGALILHNRYTSYGGKQNNFPWSQYGSYCTDSSGNHFSATYTGWDAALRGYNGYGCSGDDYYVPNVNSIYKALAENAGISTSATITDTGASATSSVTSGAQSVSEEVCNSNFPPTTTLSSYQVCTQSVSSSSCSSCSHTNTLKTSEIASSAAPQTDSGVDASGAAPTAPSTGSNTNTEKSCSDYGYNSFSGCLTNQISIQGVGTAPTYCEQICPLASSVNEIGNYTKYFGSSSYTGTARISSSDFKALLVAIADDNSWGTNPSGDYLLGYHVGTVSFAPYSTQLKTVSNILGKAFSGNSEQLGDQISGTTAYSQCASKSQSEDLIKCMLSVYHTGKVYSKGFAGIGWGFLGANTEGVDYADRVYALYSEWKTYFQNGQ